MKKHIQIKDSYKIWRPSKMGISGAALVIEWWIHNVGYYLTKPFVFIPAIRALNVRFRDVDLMVEVNEDA